MRKFACIVASAAMMSGLLGAGVAQASVSSAQQPIEAKRTKKFTISTSPLEKKESPQKFKKGKTGKVEYTITKKQYNSAIGVRLITCGKKWKSLTDWKDFKKKKGQYYTFDKSVKKGTCFRVQSGRTWAGGGSDVEGKVRYS
ncbi:hypothetical protein U9R90_10290 [Streptomyces sp. E11-3]|uniref:hypothetical protein n=1 Tax=Streptomyces sp. E11-3 TaxID=3110112 RepID=UPI00397FC2CA